MSNADRAPFGAFGRGYAANLASSFAPQLDFIRGQRSRVKSPETIAAERAALFADAIGAGQQIGEDVARVGQTGLSAATGLAQALPGMDLGFLSDAARSTGRAGAGAAVMGRALTSQAQQALAQSILAGQREAQDRETEFGAQEADILSEQRRTEADWLPAASARQDMASQAQQVKLMRAQLKNVPLERRAMVISNLMARGQLEGLDLQNAMVRRQLEQMGLKKSDIARIGKRGKGGKDDKPTGGLYGSQDPAWRRRRSQ